MLLLNHYLNDTYVGNVLSYASEAWEFHKGDAIEKNTIWKIKRPARIIS